MFDDLILERVIRLQQKSYDLLKWVGSAVEDGTVKFSKAHGAMSAPAAARDWLECHLLNLPKSCRPEKDQLQEFANIFSTYLLTSFELQEKPKPYRRSECGCFCPMCSYLVAASRLKPKKLDKRARKRAQKLKKQYLEQLAIDVGAADPTRVQAIADDAELQPQLALLAYAGELIRRSRSFVEGPAVLVLWREIAWDKDGKPDRKFRLEASAIMAAQEMLAERLRD